jgi:NAD(P)-dependent dehydrogenase (short-subunit alcohol dehydrogenase family)
MADSVSSMTATDLSGRTAIVTGASRGIGEAIAAALSAAGANVVLTSRHQEAADAAAERVGRGALGCAAHVADEDAADACVRSTVERFGSLDILVNNAGTNPAFGPLVDQDFGRFSKTFEINVWGPILWTGLAWRVWMREHGGVVINVASLGGLAVGPNMGVYHASKAALIHVTRHLALELAPDVRVTGLAPGVVRTRLAEALWKENEEAVIADTPLGRIAEPGDIADAALFLASDAARWVTGDTLIVDGGQLLGAVPARAEGS